MTFSHPSDHQHHPEQPPARREAAAEQQEDLPAPEINEGLQKTLAKENLLRQFRETAQSIQAQEWFANAEKFQEAISKKNQEFQELLQSNPELARSPELQQVISSGFEEHDKKHTEERKRRALELIAQIDLDDVEKPLDADAFRRRFETGELAVIAQDYGKHLQTDLGEAWRQKHAQFVEKRREWQKEQATAALKTADITKHPEATEAELLKELAKQDPKLKETLADLAEDDELFKDSELKQVVSQKRLEAKVLDTKPAEKPLDPEQIREAARLVERVKLPPKQHLSDAEGWLAEAQKQNAALRDFVRAHPQATVQAEVLAAAKSQFEAHDRKHNELQAEQAIRLLSRVRLPEGDRRLSEAEFFAALKAGSDELGTSLRDYEKHLLPRSDFNDALRARFADYGKDYTQKRVKEARELLKSRPLPENATDTAGIWAELSQSDPRLKAALADEQVKSALFADHEAGQILQRKQREADVDKAGAAALKTPEKEQPEASVQKLKASMALFAEHNQQIFRSEAEATEAFLKTIVDPELKNHLAADKAKVTTAMRTHPDKILIADTQALGALNRIDPTLPDQSGFTEPAQKLLFANVVAILAGKPAPPGTIDRSWLRQAGGSELAERFFAVAGGRAEGLLGEIAKQVMAAPPEPLPAATSAEQALPAKEADPQPEAAQLETHQTSPEIKQFLYLHNRNTPEAEAMLVRLFEASKGWLFDPGETLSPATLWKHDKTLFNELVATFDWPRESESAKYEELFGLLATKWEPYLQRQQAVIDEAPPEEAAPAPEAVAEEDSGEAKMDLSLAGLMEAPRADEEQAGQQPPNQEDAAKVPDASAADQDAETEQEEPPAEAETPEQPDVASEHDNTPGDSLQDQTTETAAAVAALIENPDDDLAADSAAEAAAPLKVATEDAADNLGAAEKTASPIAVKITPEAAAEAAAPAEKDAAVESDGREAIAFAPEVEAVSGEHAEEGELAEGQAVELVWEQPQAKEKPDRPMEEGAPVVPEPAAESAVAEVAGGSGEEDAAANTPPENTESLVDEETRPQAAEAALLTAALGVLAPDQNPAELNAEDRKEIISRYLLLIKEQEQAPPRNPDALLRDTLNAFAERQNATGNAAGERLAAVADSTDRGDRAGLKAISKTPLPEVEDSEAAAAKSDAAEDPQQMAEAKKPETEHPVADDAEADTPDEEALAGPPPGAEVPEASAAAAPLEEAGELPPAETPEASEAPADASLLPSDKFDEGEEGGEERDAEAADQSVATAEDDETATLSPLPVEEADAPDSATAANAAPTERSTEEAEDTAPVAAPSIEDGSAEAAPEIDRQRQAAEENDKPEAELTDAALPEKTAEKIPDLPFEKALDPAPEQEAAAEAEAAAALSEAEPDANMIETDAESESAATDSREQEQTENADADLSASSVEAVSESADTEAEEQELAPAAAEPNPGFSPAEQTAASPEEAFSAETAAEAAENTPIVELAPETDLSALSETADAETQNSEQLVEDPPAAGDGTLPAEADLPASDNGDLKEEQEQAVAAWEDDFANEGPPAPVADLPDGSSADPEEMPDSENQAEISSVAPTINEAAAENTADLAAEADQSQTTTEADLLDPRGEINEPDAEKSNIIAEQADAGSPEPDLGTSSVISAALSEHPSAAADGTVAQEAPPVAEPSGEIFSDESPDAITQQEGGPGPLPATGPGTAPEAGEAISPAESKQTAGEPAGALLPEDSPQETAPHTDFVPSPNGLPEHSVDSDFPQNAPEAEAAISEPAPGRHEGGAEEVTDLMEPADRQTEDSQDGSVAEASAAADEFEAEAAETASAEAGADQKRDNLADEPVTAEQSLHAEEELSAMESPEDLTAAYPAAKENGQASWPEQKDHAAAAETPSEAADAADAAVFEGPTEGMDDGDTLGAMKEAESSGQNGDLPPAAAEAVPDTDLQTITTGAAEDLPEQTVGEVKDETADNAEDHEAVSEADILGKTAEVKEQQDESPESVAEAEPDTLDQGTDTAEINGKELAAEEGEEQQRTEDLPEVPAQAKAVAAEAAGPASADLASESDPPADAASPLARDEEEPMLADRAPQSSAEAPQLIDGDAEAVAAAPVFTKEDSAGGQVSEIADADGPPESATIDHPATEGLPRDTDQVLPPEAAAAKTDAAEETPVPVTADEGGQLGDGPAEAEAPQEPAVTPEAIEHVPEAPATSVPGQAERVAALEALMAGSMWRVIEEDQPEIDPLKAQSPMPPEPAEAPAAAESQEAESTAWKVVDDSEIMSDMPADAEAAPEPSPDAITAAPDDENPDAEDGVDQARPEADALLITEDQAKAEEVAEDMAAAAKNAAEEEKAAQAEEAEAAKEQTEAETQGSVIIEAVEAIMESLADTGAEKSPAGFVYAPGRGSSAPTPPPAARPRENADALEERLKREFDPLLIDSLREFFRLRQITGLDDYERAVRLIREIQSTQRQRLLRDADPLLRSLLQSGTIPFGAASAATLKSALAKFAVRAEAAYGRQLKLHLFCPSDRQSGILEHAGQLAEALFAHLEKAVAKASLEPASGAVIAELEVRARGSETELHLHVTFGQGLGYRALVRLDALGAILSDEKVFG